MCPTRVLLFSLLLFVNISYAQLDDILANKTAEDLITELNALDQSKIDEITSLSNILYKTAFENNDAERMIEALQHLSTVSLNAGNTISSIDYLDKAVTIATNSNLDKKVIASLLRLKGNHYFDIEEYDKAAITYYESLEIAQEINDKYALWALQTNLGFIKLRSGDHKKALEDLKISLSLIPKLPKDNLERDRQNTMLTHARICEAYIKLNYLDSALQSNNDGLALTKLVKVDNIHIDLLMHRGILYMQKEDYKTALQFLYEAKELCSKANDVVFLGKILNLIAECKYVQEKYDESIEILSESLEILDKNFTNSDELSKCYKLLGQSYKKMGDLEKSNDFYEKHILSLSKLTNKKTSASKKVRDVTFDNYKNEIKTLESQKKRQKSRLTYSQIGLAVFGSGLILALVFFQKVKKKNRKKFDSLLSKIEKHEKQDSPEDKSTVNISKKPIIDTKDDLLDSHSNELDINDELYAQILQGLEKMESQEYYLRTECNLYNVAKKIGTNTSYLSKVINAHFDKNFNTYINDLRINYAILRLKNDTKFRSYSIKSIAGEVGYKSADSFSKYFKIHTGLLPSFYIKQLKSKS
ncbi:AraC family transcriptional regulator [Aquimarina sp. 2201CG5-10]|uniref:AraC family transcriptional regulator n=1 Tax=Aquimarina callyspongiae TaxID=3098150 RepID=UPI002AB56DE2|nr:AraC family transcriptional regulator [Aquimarina sp. 2201CG5-10]MDY8137035.1 AraC family transcriptional regulator [Aquimarina sp. 2201CG5-10]